jgi:hypothetical protein
MKLGFMLREYVEFNGRNYRVNVGFRRVMRAAALLRDNGISERVRVSVGLKLLLSPTSHTRSRFLPHAAKLALVNKIFELITPRDSAEKQSKKSVISLEKDGELIYGAFLQTYAIDLQKDELDWRKFCALLSCIPENTALFCVMKSRLAETSESLNDGLETLFKELTRE